MKSAVVGLVGLLSCGASALVVAPLRPAPSAGVARAAEPVALFGQLFGGASKGRKPDGGGTTGAYNKKAAPAKGKKVQAEPEKWSTSCCVSILTPLKIVPFSPFFLTD